MKDCSYIIVIVLMLIDISKEFIFLDIRGKPWNCDITAIFFKPCKHKINSVVRQITTLLKIFCMNLFILANINNIYSQRHLVVIFYYFFLQNDRYFQC